MSSSSQNSQSSSGNRGTITFTTTGFVRRVPVIDLCGLSDSDSDDEDIQIVSRSRITRDVSEEEEEEIRPQRMSSLVRDLREGRVPVTDRSERNRSRSPSPLLLPSSQSSKNKKSSSNSKALKKRQQGKAPASKPGNGKWESGAGRLGEAGRHGTGESGADGTMIIWRGAGATGLGAGGGGGGGGGGGNDDDEAHCVDGIGRRGQTKAARFIHLYADRMTIPGTAIFDEEDIKADLVNNRDINKTAALIYLSLLHTVKWILDNLHPEIHRTVWPEVVQARLDQTRIPELRRTIAQDYRNKRYRGIRECSECKHGIYVGWVDTICLSDPIERDGCVCCRSRKIEDTCTQTMVEGNPSFHSSAWDATEEERQAIRQWSDELDVASNMADRLQMELLVFQNPAVPAAVTEAADRLVLGKMTSVVAAREALKVSRLKIGAENGTVEGDVPRRRLRHLDNGKYLVWSMAKFFEEEQTAFADCNDAQIELVDWANTLQGEINQLVQPAHNLHIIRDMKRLINLIKGSLVDLFEEIEGARESL